MGGAPEFIVSIATLAVEDSVFSCGLIVLQAALEEVDGDVIFAHEAMAELVGYHDDATGSNGINEEAVRPVERINIAAPVMDFGPARRLHRAGNFQGEFVEVEGGMGQFTFALKAQPVAVGAQVIKSVVMDARVADMGGHPRYGIAFGSGRVGVVTSGIKLQEIRAV